MSITIDIIAGARPNFMKIAPILSALNATPNSDRTLKFRLIHTGQHYDNSLSGSFFNELGIPDPDVNLESGSGSQAEQTAKIMNDYERLLGEFRSDLCLVVGDVTSTMATSIVAQKAGIRVAHVEAGIRSGDWSMPEEINRRVTDSITNWFFTTSRYANENLIGEGVAEENIYFVGNTMIDTLLANTDRFHAPEFWNKFDLKKREYFVLTMHRPANVDESCALITMLATISVHSRGLPIIFPVHPRTAKSLKEVDNLPKNLLMVEPQSYLRFNYLVKNSFAVITDSGGITEEATVMGIPCMTLRDTTERPETIHTGTNELVGTNPENLAPYMKKLFEGNWKKGNIPEKWDGKTGQRIVSILERLLLDETP